MSRNHLAGIIFATAFAAVAVTACGKEGATTDPRTGGAAGAGASDNPTSMSQGSQPNAQGRQGPVTNLAGHPSTDNGASRGVVVDQPSGPTPNAGEHGVMHTFQGPRPANTGDPPPPPDQKK